MDQWRPFLSELANAWEESWKVCPNINGSLMAHILWEINRPRRKIVKKIPYIISCLKLEHRTPIIKEFLNTVKFLSISLKSYFCRVILRIFLKNLTSVLDAPGPLEVLPSPSVADVRYFQGRSQGDRGEIPPPTKPKNLL